MRSQVWVYIWISATQFLLQFPQKNLVPVSGEATSNTLLCSATTMTSHFFRLGAPRAFGPVAGFAIGVTVWGLGAGALQLVPLACCLYVSENVLNSLGDDEPE